MRYFVTGATGFIGSLLVERLTAEENDVIILTRNTSSSVGKFGKKVTTVQGDIFDIEVLKGGMEGVDVVFHLAALVRPTSRDNSLFYKTNVTGTANIVAACEALGVKRLIVTSTAGTIGFSEDGLPLDETAPYRPDYHTEYERTKAITEQMVLNRSDGAPDIMVVNPSRVFGPGNLSVSNSVTKMIKLYCSGIWRIIPGDGNSRGNYTFVDDVVNGHILASRHGRNGERYILGGENISYNTFFEVVASCSGKKRRLFRIKASNLKRIAHILSAAEGLAGRPPLISDNWIDKYLKNWVLSNNKAIKELGYSVTPFEEAVGRTVTWLQNRRRG